MTILDDGIEVDYAGTSGLSSRGINVPPAYCRAYSCFGIKCVVAPEIPNNWASLAPFRMKIPEGCILNAPRPYPVSVRHVIGHLLPDLMMGCLHQAVPDAGHRRRRLGAVEPAVARRFVRCPARRAATDRGGGFRDHHLQFRRHRRAADQGRAGRAPPSPPASAPCRWRPPRTSPRSSSGQKELRAGFSAGAGRTRGGFGQVMEIGAKGDAGIRGQRHVRPRRQRAEGPRGRRRRRHRLGRR